jgi:hypothetical protein
MGDTERFLAETGKVDVPLRNETPVFVSEQRMAALSMARRLTPEAARVVSCG